VAGREQQEGHADQGRVVEGALLAAALCCAWDLLFFIIKTTPATVPVALTLLGVELVGGRSRGHLNGRAT